MNEAYKRWMVDALSMTNLNGAELFTYLDTYAKVRSEPNVVEYGDACDQCVVRYFDRDSTARLGVDMDALTTDFGPSVAAQVVHDVADAADRDLRDAETDWWPQGTERAQEAKDRALSSKVGADMVRLVSTEIEDELKNHVKNGFKPYEDVVRLNDWAEYVTETDWNAVFERYRPVYGNVPEMVAMLCDNGQYTSDEVADMTLAELKEAYSSDDFEPEYRFFTDAGEDGMC